MQILIPLLIILCLSPVSMLGQQGQLKESLSLDSKILGRNVKYSIYLPYDFHTSERSYPILYLLHGYSDDETAWSQFGELKTIVDGQVGNSEITPMVIAMPDAGVDWYINSYDGKVKYEDFFINEFIPYIEANYKGRGTKEFRAVAGLSMGGHGTLVFALKHPEMFAAAAPLSAAAWGENDVLSHTQEDWEEYFGFIFGTGLSGQDRLTDHVKKNLALYLAENRDVEGIRSVKWYIDCGDDDFLINGNMDLHRILTEREVPHEFRVRDGGHTWEYWRTALPEVLKFVSKSFHR